MKRRGKLSSLKDFKHSRPVAANVLQGQLVEVGEPPGGGSLPVVFRPAAGVEVDLSAWAGANRELIEEHLARHGAALFSGFGLSGAEEFESFALAVCPDLYGDYGDLPKEEQGDKLYHSTPYPEDKTILFHNESSHTPRWPMRQFFYCAKASEEGGETPLVDCREVLRQLDPEARQMFAELGLRYVRNFIPGIDVSWQHFFKTEDRSVVESYCTEHGIGFEWLADDGLQISQQSQAVARHPDTGEEVFFNQIQLHHVACLDESVRASLEQAFEAGITPRQVYFGDGTPIADELVQSICDLYWQQAVSLPWQTGDVVLLDNMLVAHARNPFRGERKIVVAMGRMRDRTEH